MIEISQNELLEINKFYMSECCGENWGLWNLSNAPNVSVGCQFLQYNNNGKTVDILKFDEPVLISGRKIQKLLLTPDFRIIALNQRVDGTIKEMIENFGA